MERERKRAALHKKRERIHGQRVMNRRTNKNSEHNDGVSGRTQESKNDCTHDKNLRMRERERATSSTDR